MITSLQISNFQSHKKTHLDFLPGVNAITGESDSGKSAIFRALLWVATNRPSGESFRSNWGGDTEVELKMDGGIVTRTRGKGVNQYVLNGQVMEGIGVDVPAEVAKLLDLREVNIQHQLDSPFLLSETAGEVARQLNAIANLDIIDTATSNIAREVRKHTDDEKTHALELFRIGEEMKPFADLSEQEALLSTIEKHTAVVEQKRQAVIELEELIDQIHFQQGELTSVGDVARMAKLLEEADACQGTYEKKRASRENLNTVMVEIENRTRELETLAPRTKAEVPFKELVLIIESKDKLSVTYQRCKRLVDSCLATQRELTGAGLDLKTREMEFQKLMPERCPLCGQAVKR